MTGADQPSLSDAELRAWAPKPAPGAAEVRLPGYSGFQLVAEGGEGMVYRARQDGLDRFVAVKVINVNDPARVARFRRELEITVELGRQHPHIVTVLDTGVTPDGRPCIVMEYYELGSLHDRLREHGPLPVDDVVASGVAVADALAFAHGQGFLHRDVKPQNILRLPTSYVLADFGVARLADAGQTTSLRMVSYRHAAPQMIDGEPPSVVDDVWSLGSTLFTLLAGTAPFASDNPDEDTMLSYLGRLRSAEPRPLLRPDVPADLTDVIFTCLRKERADRYPDAASLRSALAAIQSGTHGWAPALPQEVGEPAGEPPSDVTERLPDEDTVIPSFGPLGHEAPVVSVSPEPLTMPVFPPPVEPLAPKRRRGRAVLLTVLALSVGVAVGVGLVVLNRPDRPATPPPPTVTSSSPAGNDPAFAPTITSLADKGTNVRLTWSDPTGGHAQFVVIDVTAAKPQPLGTVAAGTTSYTVDGLDSAKQYCFQVLAIGLADPSTQRGASPKSCTTR
ncbi:protein kinase domain-containing protein [Actinocrispum wychmicini]|uniref:non-specific serine/threonine protein kinase n=1 Tax=Actinocrispum wychmicini TaxID=1213861 RepID=A0A4R2J282_9PSEU|nr:protein kinase [Actinocrispum wychmicini]TCO52303.1 serine/threonine protein kinase [Actinocrispum wychmicini]